MNVKLKGRIDLLNETYNETNLILKWRNIFFNEIEKEFRIQKIYSGLNQQLAVHMQIRITTAFDKKYKFIPVSNFEISETVI